jgi:hypothetical protein
MSWWKYTYHILRGGGRGPLRVEHHRDGSVTAPADANVMGSVAPIVVSVVKGGLKLRNENGVVDTSDIGVPPRSATRSRP